MGSAGSPCSEKSRGSTKVVENPSSSSGVRNVLDGETQRG